MSVQRKISVFLLAQIPCLLGAMASGQDTSVPTLPPRGAIGYVLIEEDIWNAMADEPSRHIGRARDAFLMMDGRLAASELRKASVHVRIAAGNATERTKRALAKSEHDLEQLARQAEAGAFRSMEEFDKTTARALHALANDQYVRATEAWRKREVKQAGQYLRASANNLEHASARAGAQIRQATATAAKDIRLMSGKLIEGTGYVFDEVGLGFETFGTAVERLGTQVEHTAAK